ncbi:MAG TPA: hypothetical protein VEP89_07165 [Draconibacterium sp.]|nr:hypothetical protein [Draconibacterium sp.]
MKTFIPKILLFTLLLCGCQKDDFVDCTIETGAKLKRILNCPDYDCDNPVYGVATFEYDEKGRFSKVTGGLPLSWTPNDIYIPIKPGVYEYNSKGQLAKVTASDGGYYSYEYNSKGQLIKMENFVWSNSDSELHHFRTYYYTYFDDCKIEKEYIEYPLTNRFVYTLYQYGFNDKIAREEYYDNSDELDSYKIYKYDDNGNLTEKIVYREGWGPYLYLVYTYEKGLNVQTDIYNDLEKNYYLRKILKTHDDSGNLIFLESLEQRSSSQTSFSWKYEYYEE